MHTNETLIETVTRRVCILNSNLMWGGCQGCHGESLNPVCIRGLIAIRPTKYPKWHLRKSLLVSSWPVKQCFLTQWNASNLLKGMLKKWSRKCKNVFFVFAAISQSQEGIRVWFLFLSVKEIFRKMKVNFISKTLLFERLLLQIFPQLFWLKIFIFYRRKFLTNIKILAQERKGQSKKVNIFFAHFRSFIWI